MHSQQPPSQLMQTGTEVADTNSASDRVSTVCVCTPRWLEKRKNRKFTKIVRYASRKAYAEVRPRIKGRFATKEEVEAYKARQAAGIVGPEDHLMVFS